MVYNAGKKSYTIVCQEKKTYHQGFEKKFLPKQNHPYRAKKSNGRPLTNLYLWQ